MDVRRVGAHIGCQCGCKDTVATCAMLECSFSKPAKEKIAKLQAAGLTDKAIIDQFVAEFGPGVYRGDPSAYGWLVPYLLIVPGSGAHLVVHAALPQAPAHSRNWTARRTIPNWTSITSRSRRIWRIWNK